jgi:beta-aspartyl-peptidase (threonine type)
MTVHRLPLVIVHGGAGNVSPDKRADHTEGCRRAAAAGLDVLLQGGGCVEAAQRAVEMMEDDAQFNAGVGGSLNCDGGLELDASIMEGTTLRAGGVACLPPFSNPIRVARRVLEHGRHVLYAGAGAARFAEQQGFEPAPLESMRTEVALARLENYREGDVDEGWAGGTVGAVALDDGGHLAAATSTGGTVGKELGRVGDTPIIGAGTYADGSGGAGSATGIGETILRDGLTHNAVHLMRAGVPAPEAARAALAAFEGRVNGKGGLIVIDRSGAAGLAWNTQTMTHAIARKGDELRAGCEQPTSL